MTSSRQLHRTQGALGKCASIGVVGLLLLMNWSQPSRAALPNRVFGVTTIGGLAVGASYSETIRYLAPAQAHAGFDLGGCTLSYPRLGLRLWYIGNPPEKGAPRACVHFEEAIVTGPGWHTRNGLNIGDSVTKLRRLFPHVYDTRDPGPKTAPVGSIEWDITITCCGGGERPALSAMVHHDRVIALRVAMVGH